MSMTKDEIFSNVQEVLVEALGADEEEITENASLTGDLGAESIDFLDIVFRLEKAFSTDDAPFKISQGELFPENLMDNDDWISDGKFTESGLAMLRERMPHIDFTSFSADPQVSKVADLITVGSLCTFVSNKLNGAGAPA